jgi:dolichol-phosphate mannosyltransferase
MTRHDPLGSPAHDSVRPPGPIEPTSSPARPEQGAPELSCVIPIYNEAANIEPLCSRIAAAFAEHDIEEFEVLLIENGSWDESAELIQRRHFADSRFKMIQLSRNFGYQGAISAGLAHFRGEWVAILDGDQQDPPELIPTFLSKAKEGFDVVYGVRAKRQETLFRRAAYAAFYRLWKATARIKVPLDAGDFCVMHRRVAASIAAMPERQRFVRGLRAWSGFRQTGIPYNRPQRAEGETKFDLNSMVGLALDGILAYSVVPLRLMFISGVIVAAGSVLIGTVQAILRIMTWMGWDESHFGVMPPGLTQINVLLTFLLGFNILCTGVLGEYIGRIYEEVKQRPIFIVRRSLLGTGPRSTLSAEGSDTRLGTSSGIPQASSIPSSRPTS